MNKLHLTYIIDDDEITMYLAHHIMKKVDFCDEVEKFTHGMDAISRIKFAIETNQPLPDLILFDLNMPGMDGWEFIEEFSKLPLTKEIPAFIFASAMDNEELDKAKNYDAIKGVIIKPLNVQKINKILRLMDIDCVDSPDIIFRPYNQTSFYLNFGHSM
jgi:CheY-like chemotaxis protein